MLKLNGYTASERDEVRKKFYEMGKLFGLEINVVENYERNICHANLNGTVVGMAFNNDIGALDGFRRMADNVDRYHCVTRSEFDKVPVMLFFFLHEIAHLLTMTYADTPKYSDAVKVVRYTSSTNEELHSKYRAIPYEKLADNLGYELYVNNITLITKILAGEQVDISKSRVVMNQKLAKYFRAKYIKWS